MSGARASHVCSTVIAVILRTPIKRSQNSTYLVTDTPSPAAVDVSVAELDAGLGTPLDVEDVIRKGRAEYASR
jgi:hypothetical protein